MTFVAALVCILLGFISAIIEDPILFSPLAWFVASIAFSVLPGFSFGGVTLVKRNAVQE